MIRYNRITGDPVIVAPERAARPNVYRGDAACPFCPGHESETPPEIARSGEPWRVRVFPNRFPATERHEVVVETPLHGARFDELEPADAEASVRLYVERYRALADDPHVGHICVFKNHGPSAGASIPHIHSQIVATSFAPPRIARERDGFARASSCPLCAPHDLGIILDEAGHFVWIAPLAASVAHETWIVPRTHANELPAIESERELASLLQRATKHLDAFNWIVMSFRDAPAAHWYVQIVPRHSVFAGFEIGTGCTINTYDPAQHQ